MLVRFSHSLAHLIRWRRARLNITHLCDGLVLSWHVQWKKKFMDSWMEFCKYLPRTAIVYCVASIFYLQKVSRTVRASVWERTFSSVANTVPAGNLLMPLVRVLIFWWILRVFLMTETGFRWPSALPPWWSLKLRALTKNICGSDFLHSIIIFCSITRHSSQIAHFWVTKSLEMDDRESCLPTPKNRRN